MKWISNEKHSEVHELKAFKSFFQISLTMSQCTEFGQTHQVLHHGDFSRLGSALDNFHRPSLPQHWPCCERISDASHFNYVLPPPPPRSSVFNLFG